MCKPHWRQYANALRKAAVARKAAQEPAEVALAHAVLDEISEPLTIEEPTKASTKRERRRTPMAHIPSKGGDVPPETK
jgi:hypothetical protein